MALCHDERDYVMGFSRVPPQSLGWQPRKRSEQSEDRRRRIGPASGRFYHESSFITDTRDDIVRVMHERGPIRLEDFFSSIKGSREVNGGWISKDEIKDHLQFMRRMGMVRCDREKDWPKYFRWSLILPHPLIFLTPAASP